MPEESRRPLAARLRDLRRSWDGVTVTQRHVAEAIGASPALVSSWENGSAVPPEERLRQYAQFFATPKSMDPGPRLPPFGDLSTAEDERRSELIDELVRLREEALFLPDSGPRRSGALGGRFWHFPGAQPITILYTPLSDRQLGVADPDRLDEAPPVAQYARNRTHPNAVLNLRNGDVDALLELVGHVRAENPTADVRWVPNTDVTESDQLTGHVVILGSGDQLLEIPERQLRVWSLFRDAVSLPVSFRGDIRPDEEFELEFEVTTDADGVPAFDGDRRERHGPRFVRDERVEGRPRVVVNGAPVLASDVALILRMPNPLNESARLIMCSGLFARGTYGAVRAFTDANLRARNEAWVSNLSDPERFWALIRVTVAGFGKTITPDLARGSQRIHVLSS